MNHRSASALSIPFPVVVVDVLEPAANAPAVDAHADGAGEETEDIAAAKRIHRLRIDIWARLLLHAARSGVSADRDDLPEEVAGFLGGDPAAEGRRESLAHRLAESDRTLDRAASLRAVVRVDAAIETAWRAYHRERSDFAQRYARLVRSTARAFGGRGLDREDLEQQGTLGLLGAIDRYDYARGVRFSTYAVWWIRNAMTQLGNGGLIRVPPHARRAQYRLIRLREEARRAGESEPDEGSLLQAGLSELVRQRISFLPSGPVRSIDPQDDLPAGTELECAHERVEREAEHQALLSAVDVLDDRQRAIVVRRFGLEGHEVAKLADIGRDLGISAERVRQLEHQALARLRKAMSDWTAPVRRQVAEKSSTMLRAA